ncbi:MAG: uroporphyrinogen decarboxylase family protein [Phycisphaerales bacterium]|jgi:uroporphyrinogen decarboxylase
MMTSKERVHRALQRDPVDRVPIFMWYHPQTRRRLSKLLEIPAEHVPSVMGDDVRQAWVSNNHAMEGIVHERDGQSHVDDWSIEWTRTDGFNQISRYPLADAGNEQVLEYRFPFDRVDPLVDLLKPAMLSADRYFVGCDVSPCVFEMYWRLRGMEKTLTEIVLNPGLTRDMMRRCTEFSIALSETACQRFNLDWLWLGDDVGGQQSMLMSPGTWREMIKPLLKENADVGKRRGIYVAFHSCGAIRPIIGDLIEIGIDVLNPIQCNCPGMDPLELKKEFGRELAFMGGVDTQDLLPHGTADQVRSATAELLEGMTADGGGYILAASHTVPPETPDDNIFAMYDEAGITREEIFDKAAALRRSLRPGPGA